MNVSLFPLILFTLTEMKVMSNHISILYPTQQDFNCFDERQEPQIFNYICLHGKQLFITSANRQYEVVSSGWIPEDSRNITNLEKFKTYHCILRTKHRRRVKLIMNVIFFAIIIRKRNQLSFMA